MKRLPTRDAMLLYIDFAALRQAGILKLIEGSKAAEEADYSAFVKQTKFDYQKDLDSALVAFAPTGNFMLVKGNFDWDSLRAYARKQQGRCDESLCRMQGSTPARRISFFLLRSNLLALAVSADDTAALRLKAEVEGATSTAPDGPVWMSIPPSTLRSGEGLPEGARMFAHSLTRAESAALTLSPEGNRMAAKLNVVCGTAQDATDAADQLTRVTKLLNQLIEREHAKANPADLSGVLVSGTFQSKGMSVFGYWPIEMAFIENMFGGKN